MIPPWGIFIQDHLLPPEYVHTMRDHMLDKCPVSSPAEVAKTLREDLGAGPEELFRSFEEAPIASASLAQVMECCSGELLPCLSSQRAPCLKYHTLCACMALWH